MLRKTPAESVNPYIGTVGHLLTATRPTAMLPHGTAQIHPHVSPNANDYYFSEQITAFPLGAAVLQFAAADAVVFSDGTSHFDMSTVQSHPYSYRVFLEDSGIDVCGVPAMHSYLYRASGAKKLLLRIPNAEAIEVRGDALYFARTVSSPKSTHQRRAYTVLRLTPACPLPLHTDMQDDCLILDGISDPCTVSASVSYISFEKAEEIFARELAGKDAETLEAEAKAVWEDLLGRVKVEGGTDDFRTAYYTALYRSFIRMNQFGEYGQYYSGYDGEIHDGDDFYCNDQLWDSFRSMHPLQLLLEPDNHKKMLESYLAMYRQSGAMPSFPGMDGDSPCMIGFHAASLFADALAKGIDVDYETAFEGLYRSATQTTMLPWVADKPANELDRCYYEKGFFPALEIGEEEWVSDVHDFERRQCLAVTLEHAYDDWCIAQLAKHLGKEDIYEQFSRRAQNYRNIYNTEIGFMAPKNAAGDWIAGYDPMCGGGQGGRAYFAECNAYTFNFSVWHDIDGLAELMGGKDGMCARLDALFTTPNPGKYGFLSQFPDSTGLMGMFCMGNEPSFHIPFLYNFAGRPWMTQRRLRTIIELWFTNSPLGICGDEDGGAMSSWLAFAALGLYPVCPGKAEYALTTPMFDRITLTLGENTFTVIADGAGNGLRYIQSAALNGKPFDRPFLTHHELTSGGTLVLTLGDRPNRDWGVPGQA